MPSHSNKPEPVRAVAHERLDARLEDLVRGCAKPRGRRFPRPPSPSLEDSQAPMKA